ncbi:WD40/YVTN repeat-like-containing domain protein [Moelleriella libera RCEF 2490]|uniref:WD40/YVTN repeat-like-containing domain protein n=1 Tax=Moelleriella libera RCEF 2490 TaxID=1081109 RepID=A0A168CL15_9HYPO|nr:WD40/YVTN repeat-like-containing domain protein [Moelleriella libera RCEF 2490]
MAQASLTSLSPDIFLDIVEYSDTARDLANLGRVNRYLNDVVAEAGWKTFVTTKFPWARVPSAIQWRSAADRLTYLDRCWERRALHYSIFGPPPKLDRRPHSGPAPFQAVVEGHHSAVLGQDVLAWGCGEDLFVKWSPKFGEEKTTQPIWRAVPGSRGGYTAGMGDVTALEFIERHPGAPELVVGRANGQVQVISARNKDHVLGHPVQAPLQLVEGPDTQNLGGISPGRLAVNSVAWQDDANLLTAGRSSHVHFFRASQSADDGRLEAVASCDLSAHNLHAKDCCVRDIKFVDSNLVAIALASSRRPLQLGRLRPDGVVFEPAPLNGKLPQREEGTPRGGNTTVWSIQPVAQRNANLLLSSWEDGTFRLIDVRTPASWDAVYRDTFQPFHAGGPLLVYGTERFLTGDMPGPTLRIFDFRFDKPYFHTSAMACSSEIPDAKSGRKKLFRGLDNPPREPEPEPARIAQCEPANGISCTWHKRCASQNFRQDSTIWALGRHSDCVFSMAKTSDLSDTFYLGLRGAVIEARLQLDKDAWEPNKERPRGSWPQGWVKESSSLGKISTGAVSRWQDRLCEGGIGLRNCTWNPSLNRTDTEHCCRMPDIYFRDHPETWEDSERRIAKFSKLRPWQRLEASYAHQLQ